MSKLKKKKDDRQVKDALTAYIEEIEKYPVLSKKEIRRLAHAMRDGDSDARQKLILHNLRFVVYIARKYFSKFPNVDPLDIIQYGNEGLMKAVDRYDPEGSELTTYSAYWIEQSINRHLGYDYSDIKTPEDVSIKIRKYKVIVNKAEQMGKEIPSDEELMSTLDVTKDTLEHIKRNAQIQVVSLNKTINSRDNEDTTLEYFIPDDNIRKPEDAVNYLDDFELLIVLKEKLSPLHYYILYRMLLGEKEYTAVVLAEEIGISFSRVPQLLDEAKREVRKFLGEDRTLLYSEAMSIKQREKAHYYNLNTKPVSPKEIINYLYLKRHFDGTQREILKDILLHKYNLSSSLNARRLSLTEGQYKEMLNNIMAKTKNILKDTYEYDDFAKNFTRTYGTKMFNLDLDSDYKFINYNELTARYSNMTLDEIKELYGDEFNILPDNSKKLLQAYFGVPDSGVLEKNRIERDVNLALFNYQDKDIKTPVNKLYRTYLKNKDSFNDEHQLMLECYLFNKKDKNQYLNKYSKFTYGNFAYEIFRLEKMHYGLENIYWYPSLTKEMYESVLKKHRDKLSKERIKALNMYYGVGSDAKSIQEIADEFGEEYIKMHGFLMKSKDFVYRLYLNRSIKKSINKSIYTKYIENVAYELTNETREILKYHVIDDLDYETISKMTGLNKKRISDIITEGLRKLDYYRFGINKATIISKQELSLFFKVHNRVFSELDKKIIRLRFVEHLEVSEIVEKLKTDKTIVKAEKLKINSTFVKNVNKRFVNLFVADKYKNIKLMPTEIKRELDSYYLDSVLSDEEKLALSYDEGIPYGNNKIGEKLSNTYAAIKMDITTDKFIGLKRTARLKLQKRVVGDLNPDDMYMDRLELDKLLDCTNLPISEKERDIICYTCELKGKEKKSFEDLASIYGEREESIKRRYQRAIINILKYKNKEIEGKIDFDTDICQYLKYFSKVDQAYIRDYYKDGLSYDALAKKYDISYYKIVDIFDNIKIRLNDMQNNQKRKFDYDYAEMVIDDPCLPFIGDLDLAKKLYNMTFNSSDMERLSNPEIVKRLNLDISPDYAKVFIINFMIAISKRHDGIKKGREFSYEEIVDYYDRHKDSMSKYRTRIYNNYLNMTKRYPTSKISKRAHLDIRFDLIKEQHDDCFNLETASRDDVLSILKNKQVRLSRRIRESLMQLYNITGRELMTGTEINHVYRLLNTLDEKIKSMKETNEKKLEL